MIRAGSKPSAARRRLLCCCALLVVVLSATASWAQDSDQFRYYLHIRGHGSSPFTDVHDLFGASVGANFNRHWGAELSVEGFERRIRVNDRVLGEYAIMPIVPQVRFRYPVLDGRLTPYAIAGVGVAFTEFNDRKKPGFGVSIDTPASTVVGTVGAGLEYFIAHNVAVGVEVKYMIAGDQTIKINGVSRTEEIDSLITSFGLRLFFPENAPPPPAEPRGGFPARAYLGMQVGAAFITDTGSMAGVELRDEPAAVGPANYYIGGLVGLDLGKYLGFELMAGGYEGRLEAPGRGSIGEEAVYAIIPQLRARYPVLDGRLVPYAVAGVGASYVEFNDRKRGGLDLDIAATNWGVAATVGAGLEYFIASNIAASIEARYLTARGHTIKIGGGQTHDAHADAMLVTVGLRVYLFDLRF